MRTFFETSYRDELENTLREADRARAHDFEFFGGRYHYGREIEWQKDPVTGRTWPAIYHADVPVHGGDVGFGDVKHVWELSRQQYLVDLGKAFFLTGRTEDLEAARHLVRSWRLGNPYATGVNWACALEPAFRVLSWLWAYHLCADALDDEFHVEWLEGFHDHGRFLAKHLEHYSSPYNHLIGEATALYSLGLCFPEFAASTAWCDAGRAVLEGRLDEQFYPDGGTVEQSTFYHHATLGFYLLAALTARANGQELSAAVWAAIERGIEFSMHLSQPDGYTPAIGGADDGKPIRMEHLPFWDFRPYQAIGAVLFARPDFKFAAGRYYEDALWLLGADGHRTFDELDSRAPRQTAILLARSGYAVSRSDWSDRADYVCFDVGEQAAGMRTDAVPNSMHGHADCLSVVACLAGRRVLVDSGLYAYNCGGDWEAHFRETAAHNTARIDGRDQARHIGKMAWSHSYRASVEGHAEEPAYGWTVASHDGYSREPIGVTHRRAVWLRPEGCLLIYDEFVGNAAHDLEIVWQFAPGLLRAQDDTSVLFDDCVEMAWCSTVPWRHDCTSGGPGPADGWICPSLGVRRPAPRLTIRSRSQAGTVSLVTAFAARLSDGPRLRATSKDGVGMLAIAGTATTEWAAAAGVSHGGPISTDALLAVVTVQGQHVIGQTQLGGTTLQVDEGVLMDWVRESQVSR